MDENTEVEYQVKCLRTDMVTTNRRVNKIIDDLRQSIKGNNTRIKKLETLDKGNNLSFVNLNNAIVILRERLDKKDNQIKVFQNSLTEISNCVEKLKKDIDLAHLQAVIKDNTDTISTTTIRVDNIVEKVADLNKTMDKSWHNFQASYATTNIRIELLDKQFEQFLSKNKALVKPENKSRTSIDNILENILKQLLSARKRCDHQEVYSIVGRSKEFLENYLDGVLDRTKIKNKPVWIDQFLKDFASTEFNWFGLNEKYKDRIKKYLEGKEPLEVKHIAWIKNFFVKIMKAYFTSDTIMVYDALDDYNKKIARYIEDES